MMHLSVYAEEIRKHCILSSFWSLYLLQLIYDHDQENPVKGIRFSIHCLFIARIQFGGLERTPRKRGMYDSEDVIAHYGLCVKGIVSYVIPEKYAVFSHSNNIEDPVIGVEFTGVK